MCLKSAKFWTFLFKNKIQNFGDFEHRKVQFLDLLNRQIAKCWTFSKKMVQNFADLTYQNVQNLDLFIRKIGKILDLFWGKNFWGGICHPGHPRCYGTGQGLFIKCVYYKPFVDTHRRKVTEMQPL